MSTIPDRERGARGEGDRLVTCDKPHMLGLNAGSSSMEFCCVTGEPDAQLHRTIDRLGSRGAALTSDAAVRPPQESSSHGDSDHRSAANHLSDWLD